MSEELAARLRVLANRAGLGGVPPAVVGAALVVFGMAVVFAAWRWWPGRAGGETLSSTSAGEPGRVEVASGVSVDATTGGGAAAGAAGRPSSGGATGTVFVHVVGAVGQPGLYELPRGSRVADAVGAAGGLTGAAGQAGINLARLVEDGEQVVVPTADEVAKGAPPASVGGATGPSAGAAASAAIVDINTADAAALDTLPGVGPSTAAKIVADREANGPFASPDDLGRVPGIGPKKLEQLKPMIRVR